MRPAAQSEQRNREMTRNIDDRRRKRKRKRKA
jgi:hypothetical protein